MEPASSFRLYWGCRGRDNTVSLPLLVQSARNDRTTCRHLFGKKSVDPITIIGKRSILMHFLIDLIEQCTYQVDLFFLHSEKLWYKMCFPSPGSLGRNLTDSPPRSISTGVYVGIQISQGKIHYLPLPCVLALRKNRKEHAKGSDFCFYCIFKEISLGWDGMSLVPSRTKKNWLS